MLKNFKKQLQKEIEEMRAKIVTLKNSVSEDDLAVLNEALANAQAKLDALIADETEHTIEDAIKQVKAVFDDALAMVQEKEDVQTGAEQQAENGYLKSKNSVHDWCNALRNAKGNKDAFCYEWGQALKTNGITIATGSEDAYLPEAVKGAIQDKWEKRIGWLSSLNNTGAKRFFARYNDADQDSTDVRAKGHTAGNTKTQQSLTLKSKTIDTQAIYKMIAIDNKTIFDDDTALLTYVADELSRQWFYEVSKAILVGDGRSSSSADKINSIESIDRSTTDAFVTVTTHNTANYLIDEVRAMTDALVNENDEEVLLFMKKADVTALERVVFGTGSTPQYVDDNIMASQLGATRIIRTNALGDGVKAIAMIPSRYVTCGNMAPEFVSWEERKTNEQWWRVEAYIGGGVEGLKSASVLKEASAE